MENLTKIWKDPVWSKIIAYLIVGLLSIFISGLIAYFKTPADTRAEESIVSVLFSYNFTVNLFSIFSALLFLLFVSIGILYRKYFYTYDLFISSPMSGFQNEEEYIEFRNVCLEVKLALQNKCGFKKIYYAGEHKPTKRHFSIPRVAFLKDLAALKNSKRFLLIHPGKIYSSTLFECGYAYRKQTKSIYFVKNIEDLPFLMRHLSDVASFVSIICVNNIKNITNVIANDSTDIFC